MKTGMRQQLDPSRRSTEALDFHSNLYSKIVGQPGAIEKFVEIYQIFLAGLNSMGRPVGNLLFLGPTGTGKTRVVEAVAEILFGDRRSLIRVDCAEFQHSHEIAKLIGSPPGYLGHRETHPLITQEELSKSHTDKLKLSLLLFDEIEKASDALWQLLLGMLDKATLTLGDNRRVDLSQTIIVLTSNLGGGEITELMNGGMGFISPTITANTELDLKVERTAVGAARRKFSPEFMNRIDKTIVFNALKEDDLRQILDIELSNLQGRIWDNVKAQFGFSCTQAVKNHLLAEGTSMRYGARELKRVIERGLTFPLANLTATGQLRTGDMVKIDLDGEGFIFTKEAEGALPALLAEKYNLPAQPGAIIHGEAADVVQPRPAPAGNAPSKRKKEDGPTTVF